MWDLTLFTVFADQNLYLDPMTLKATGNYTTVADDGAGNVLTDTWAWDLTLTTPTPP